MNNRNYNFKDSKLHNYVEYKTIIKGDDTIAFFLKDLKSDALNPKNYTSFVSKFQRRMKAITSDNNALSLIKENHRYGMVTLTFPINLMEQSDYLFFCILGDFNTANKVLANPHQILVNSTEDRVSIIIEHFVPYVTNVTDLIKNIDTNGIEVQISEQTCANIDAQRLNERLRPFFDLPKPFSDHFKDMIFKKSDGIISLKSQSLRLLDATKLVCKLVGYDKSDTNKVLSRIFPNSVPVTSIENNNNFSNSNHGNESHNNNNYQTPIYINDIISVEVTPLNLEPTTTKSTEGSNQSPEGGTTTNISRENTMPIHPLRRVESIVLSSRINYLMFPNSTPLQDELRAEGLAEHSKDTLQKKIIIFK